jgi:hypothetical protein
VAEAALSIDEGWEVGEIVEYWWWWSEDVGYPLMKRDIHLVKVTAWFALPDIFLDWDHRILPQGSPALGTTGLWETDTQSLSFSFCDCPTSSGYSS